MQTESSLAELSIIKSLHSRYPETEVINSSRTSISLTIEDAVKEALTSAR
jgi:flavin-binding protein dodecin